MRFALSEEQRELAATVRAALERHGDARVPRYDESLWRMLCDQIGVAALNVPEEQGGFGATLVESAVVLAEVGRTLVPAPLLSSMVVSGWMLPR